MRTDGIKKILLIDDDASIRRMYTDYLANDGFVVTAVPSAIEGLDILSKGEEFDLVITDIMMAKMDGWEFLHAIRNDLGFKPTRLPVIVISAFESATIEAKALSCGANASYIKGGQPLSRLLREARIQTGRERSRFDD